MVKKVFRIIAYVLLGLLALLSLVFTFIEIRSLCAGDYQLMNNPSLSFVGYLFRGLFYFSLMSYSLYLIFFFIMKKEPSFPHYMIAITMLISSIITVFFYVSSIYFIPIVIALLLCGIVTFRRFVVSNK